MSFINHLIKRAKEAEQFCTLDVPAPKVGALVEHIVGCGWGCGRERARQELLDGNVLLLGCRLRVVGKIDA